MTDFLFKHSTTVGQPGYFLHGLLLDGNPTFSEGVYRLNHWAVRLGRDAHSDEARMASLHEMYHATLNDSTAYGTLMHVVGLFCRTYPEENQWPNLLQALIDSALRCHETYATYASVFVVGKGSPNRAVLEQYPESH